MEFYLPSLFIILLAAIFAVSIIPRFAPIILAVFAGLSLVLALYNHSSLFYNEYKNMNWANTAIISGASPYLMTGLIILLCLGYIIMLVTSGEAPSLSRPSMIIPPPSTATNTLTRGIGTSLVNAGVASVNRNYSPPANTSGQAALESALARAA
jgi:hypothetical protein